MITYVKTNLFESPAQVLVNTVNTVGVMGKGIAKQFKDIYPDMFKEYQTYCEKGLLDVGKLWIYKTSHKWILNFPTKKHWKAPSKIEYIELGLQKFVDTYAEKGINSVSFPLLGCGNGGLDWESQVKPLMEKHLKPLPIDVFIHLSDKTKRVEHFNIAETEKWLHSEPKMLSFNEVWEDLQQLLIENNKITVNNNVFEIYVTKEPELGLNFISIEKSFIISQDELLDLWRHLRTVGFCSLSNMPSGLYEVGPILFNLFAELRYVEPAQMAHAINSDSDLKYGIRLIPYIGYSLQSSSEAIVDAIEK